MEEEKKHGWDDERTISDIEKYGLSVILIEESDYLPSFAYSIGLWQKYNHPEIICFGLSVQTLHGIINDAADFIKKGNVIETDRSYDDFFEKGNAEFIKVDSRNINDYFGTALDFYGVENLPAIQLIWTDRNDKFPWDEGFEDEFIYRQPLLDRNADFKFREAENLGVFTTRQWLEEKKPIVQVIHNVDGDWQFLTGDQMLEDAKIVALKELVLRDPTLNKVFDLEYGEEAIRTQIGGKWRRK
jgi:hypothetical protein